jgi:hypothetical protein
MSELPFGDIRFEFRRLRKDAGATIAAVAALALAIGAPVATAVAFGLALLASLAASRIDLTRSLREE